MIYKKVSIKSFAALFLLLAVLGNANLTIAKAVETPEQTAAEFYKWYLHELNSEKEPRSENKIMLKYVSNRVARRFKTKDYKEYDADYFIQAQDFDKEWEDTVSVSRASVKGNKALLTVTLGVFKNGKKYNGIGKHVLHLTMVKENNLWKIDRVDR